tara:strand:+ start:176 stop:502 length:327 start_codon:yes stop_codon:yes gene_type:complete
LVRESELERRTREDFESALIEEFKKAELQSEVRQVITQYPKDLREKKFDDEMVIAEDEEIAEENTEKRMLTESPMLSENKVKFDGQHLIPDFANFDKTDTRPTWMREE